MRQKIASVKVFYHFPKKAISSGFAVLCCVAREIRRYEHGFLGVGGFATVGKRMSRVLLCMAVLSLGLKL
jgi:hypothetical protein